MNAPKVLIVGSDKDIDAINEIEKDFQLIGLQFIRDYEEGYLNLSKEECLDKLMEADYLLLVISDSFLKSLNLMYRILLVYDDAGCRNKILPIIVGDAINAFKPLALSERIPYIKYWEKKSGVQGEGVDRKAFDFVCKNMDKFISTLSKELLVAYDSLRSHKYMQILDFIRFECNEATNELLYIRNIEDDDRKEACIDKFLYENNNSALGYFMKGALMEEKGNFGLAQICYENAVNKNSGYVYAYHSLGDLLANHFKDYTGAKKCYERAVCADPLRGESYYKLALFLENVLSDRKTAFENYKKAFELKPKDLRVCCRIAYLLETEFNDINGADDSYRKALAINPYDVDVLSCYAHFLINKLRNYQDAVKYLDKAVSVEPHIDLLIELGNLSCEYLDEADKAADYYQTALVMQPDNTEANLKLAGLFEKAASNTGLAEDKRLRYYYHMGVYYENRGDFANARQCYESAIKLCPEFTDAINRLAKLLGDKLGDYEGASRHYEKSIDINPNQVFVYKNYGLFLEHCCNDYEAAKKCYMKAIELEPGNAELYNRLGLLLANRLNEYEEAILNFRHAISKEPAFAQAYYNLADTLETRLEDHAGARLNCEKAISLDPNLADGYGLLAALLLHEPVDILRSMRAFKTYTELIKKHD